MSENKTSISLCFISGGNQKADWLCVAASGYDQYQNMRSLSSGLMMHSAPTRSSSAVFWETLYFTVPMLHISHAILK